jgi:hypothetical protein
MKRGRFKMLGILLVCAAPVVASYLTYYVIRPNARSNYGTLIANEPALPSKQNLQLQTLKGDAFDPQQLTQQWLLVVVGGGACTQQCEHQLWLQRQLRESLGREKDRIDRVWFVEDDQPVKSALQLAMQGEGASIFHAPRTQIAAWLQPEAGNSLEDHVYLIDPMGRWMMRFPPQLDFSKAKRDLERLLRASASWDRAGREERPPSR